MWSIGWEFHGFWNTIAHFVSISHFYFTTDSSIHVYILRSCLDLHCACFLSLFLVFFASHAQANAHETVTSQMLPIFFMTFSWFCSHWNNSLDRSCCCAVNTILFGWLGSIKKNRLVFVCVRIDRVVFSLSLLLVYLCVAFHHMVHNNMPISTGFSMSLYSCISCDTQLFYRIASVELFNQV